MPSRKVSMRASMANQTSHLGIMGGLAKGRTSGASGNRATNKLVIPRGAAKGLAYMQLHGILSRNPQTGGVGKVVKSKPCNCKGSKQNIKENIEENIDEGELDTVCSDRASCSSQGDCSNGACDCDPGWCGEFCADCAGAGCQETDVHACSSLGSNWIALPLGAGAKTQDNHFGNGWTGADGNTASCYNKNEYGQQPCFNTQSPGPDASGGWCEFANCPSGYYLDSYTPDSCIKGEDVWYACNDYGVYSSCDAACPGQQDFGYGRMDWAQCVKDC